jgi:hypothetical protein
MRQLVLISIVVAGATPGVFAQNPPSLTREGRYWVRTIEGASSVSLPAVRLRLDTVGNVVLRGEAGDSATYTLKARVQARNIHEAEALLGPLGLKSRNEGEWTYLTVSPPRNALEAPELSLSVPRRLRQVRIETRGGSVQARDLDGELEAHSAGGKIDVDIIRGRTEVRTGGGDIQVGSVGGPLRCYSGGGAVRVGNTGGECWLDTAGGEILVHDAKGSVHATTAGGNIRVDRAGGPVFARTAAGLIQVQQAAGEVTAESSGGAIQVGAANGVRCDSAAGAIWLRNVAGALRASTSAGSILTELLAGNRIEDSTLSTNAGDITVFIASTLPLTVLARNESGSAVGRIVSDFPEIRVRPVAQTGASHSIAEGVLNGGGPVLHINVIGGTIYLRRQK